MHAFSLDTPDGVRLEGERTGSGVPLVLLHGLTATRRYVVMGSRYLARAGCLLVSYDARGHGSSSPAGTRQGYDYSSLVGDLRCVVERLDQGPVVLVGNSMGAATAAAFALAAPDLVEALVFVTPGYSGGERDDAEMGDWNALADGLERGGVDGFMQAYTPPSNPRFREATLEFTRQRLERHEHPQAVADALRVVPRAVAFEGLDALERLTMPALVVGSRDESDPGHPLELAQAYVEHLPHAQLVVEDEGASPIAWQGAQLSRIIERFLQDTRLL